MVRFTSRHKRSTLMGMTRDIGQYTDVRATLDIILSARGGITAFDTRAEAIRWRQRAYMLRTLMSEADQRSTPYDGMVLRNPVESGHGWTVAVECERRDNIRIFDLQGNLITPQPTPITITPADAPSREDFDNVAYQLHREQGDFAEKPKRKRTRK